MRGRRYLLRGWRSERGSQGLEAAGAALAAALIVLALLAGARGAMGPRVLEAFQCAAAALGAGGGGCGGGAAADTTGTVAPQQAAAQQDQGGFTWLDGLQVVLDGVGLVPVAGEAADAANVVISLLRGDTTGALLSLGAMIPIGGWLATGGKAVRNGVRYSDEAAAAARSGDNVAGAATRCATHAPPGKGPGLAKPLQACITPSKAPDPNATPGGTPARIRSQDDAATIRSLTRENESAKTLAEAGYDVVQRPPTLPNGKNPDYVIEGQIFDNYAPSTSNARNIASTIQNEKIATGQTERIVLNLDDSRVSLDALRRQLTDYPIPGLKELIIVRDGTVTPFFP